VVPDLPGPKTKKDGAEVSGSSRSLLVTDASASLWPYLAPRRSVELSFTHFPDRIYSRSLSSNQSTIHSQDLIKCHASKTASSVSLTGGSRNEAASEVGVPGYTGH
jgi:hypothetical protein